MWAGDSHRMSRGMVWLDCLVLTVVFGAVGFGLVAATCVCSCGDSTCRWACGVACRPVEHGFHDPGCDLCGAVRVQQVLLLHAVALLWVEAWLPCVPHIMCHRVTAPVLHWHRQTRRLLGHQVASMAISICRCQLWAETNILFQIAVPSLMPTLLAAQLTGTCCRLCISFKQSYPPACTLHARIWTLHTNMRQHAPVWTEARILTHHNNGLRFYALSFFWGTRHTVHGLQQLQELLLQKQPVQ